VKVTLPGATFKTLDLNVTAKQLQVTSPQYKLSLHLPHTVNSDKGSAKWDSKRCVLSVTLPVVPEDE